MSMGCLRHWLLPLKLGRRRERLLLLGLWSLWISWVMIREIVKYILLAFSFPKQLCRVTILHLILMKGCNLHFYWIFPLLFLEWTSFLLEFYFNRFRMLVGTSIRVVLLFSLKPSLGFLFLLPEIKAILMIFKLLFMGWSRGLSLWFMKIEVKILSKFGWLSLS